MRLENYRFLDIQRSFYPSIPGFLLQHTYGIFTIQRWRRIVVAPGEWECDRHYNSAADGDCPTKVAYMYVM